MSHDSTDSTGRDDAAPASTSRLAPPRDTGDRSVDRPVAGGLDAAPAPGESRRPTIWLDITDLYSYAVDGNTTVSGIQRVVANLITRSELAGMPVRVVIPEYDNFRVFTADLAQTRRLVDVLQTGGLPAATVKTYVAAVAESRRPVEPAAGDLFVMPGAFWIAPHFDLLVRLRARGVRIALFVHDLIQINNPAYVHEAANRAFRERLIDVLAIVDIVLTNSHFVADDLRRYMRERLDLDIPVTAVPLPTELPHVPRTGEALPPELLAATGREFVLCVGTIEIRKNHRYLVEIWQRLEREGIPVPNLVFVGKWGWRIEDLKREVEEGDALGRWLFVLGGLSDVGLDHLYEHCLFTAYVSFAEGFGLPVGESLAHGKPCIAANATSLPEVGGAFARYVDPFDIEDGHEAIRSVLADRAALAAWAERIRTSFRPKTWDAFCRDFYEALGRTPTGPRDPQLANFVLPSGRLLFVGSDDVVRLDRRGAPLLTLRMARQEGWHPVEGWGVWARAPRAVLSFATDLRAGTRVSLVLRLRATGPDAEATSPSVDIGGVRTALAPLSGADGFLWCDGLVSDAGILAVAIDYPGEADVDGGGRARFFGLSALAFWRQDDIATRLSVLEEVAAETSRRPAIVAAAGPAPSRGGSVREGAALRRLLLGTLTRPRRSPLRRAVRAVTLWAARRAARHRDFPVAERRYGRALRLDPSDARTWIQFGHVVKSQGDMEAALDAYGLATRADPKAGDPFRQLGLALRAANRTYEAEAALKQYRELTGDEADVI